MRRIDAAILHWHQDLVDFLQRQPVQLARACAAVYTVCVFMLWFMRDAPADWAWIRYVLMLIDMLGITCVCFGALSARLLAIVGADAFSLRCVLLVCLGFDMLAATLTPGLNNAAALLRDVAVLMYFYFAVCRPPKPKPPVHKMAHAPGAA